MLVVSQFTLYADCRKGKRPNFIKAAKGEQARKEGFTLTAKLRGSGIKTEFDHVGKSFKAQFKYANKIDARFVAILGDEELERGEVKLKDMETGDEGYVPIAALGNRVQQILR